MNPDPHRGYGFCWGASFLTLPLPQPKPVTFTRGFSNPCQSLLRYYFIQQKAEFPSMHISRAKLLQPALMRQVTCHSRHTRNFNFACRYQPGPRYSHALSLQTHTISTNNHPPTDVHQLWLISFSSVDFTSNLCLQVVTSCTNLKGRNSPKNIKYHN